MNSTCWPTTSCDIRKPRKETIRKGGHSDPKVLCGKHKAKAEEEAQKALAKKNREEDRPRKAREADLTKMVREEARAKKAREEAQHSRQGQGSGAISGKPRQ